MGRGAPDRAESVFHFSFAWDATKVHVLATFLYVLLEILVAYFNA
jgi:hypothetical protein